MKVWCSSKRFANFSSAVCNGSNLRHGHAPMHWGGNDLSINWKGVAYCFHPSNKTGAYQLPSITGCHGHPISASPPWQYKGPHLNAGLPNETDTVTLSYDGCVLDYKFADGADEIAQRSTTGVAC